MTDSGERHQDISDASQQAAKDAADPLASAARLARIVNDYPDLQHVVADNPATSPELLDWLGTYGTAQAQRAVAARRTSQPAGALEPYAPGAAASPAGDQPPAAPPYSSGLSARAPAPTGYQRPSPDSFNPMSILALICGVVGIPLLAWVFGGMGLYQLSRAPQRGRGLAIAGIVLGAAWFVGVLVAIMTGVLVINR